MTDSPLDRVALIAEKAELQRKLAKRTNQPGYKANCEEITARLAEIEDALADG